MESLEFLNLKYSLKFEGSQNVKLLWKDYDSKKPNSIIFKFKFNPEYPVSQSLFESQNKFAVVAEKTGDYPTSGTLKFLLTGSSGIKSCSIAELPIFDGNFWNLLLQRSISTTATNVNQVYTLKINKIELGEVEFYTSASLQITGSLTSSYNTSYNTSTDFYIGGLIPTSSFLSIAPFVGNVSDLKFYRVILQDSVFQEHCLAQSLLVSNNVSSSFEDLVTHFRFNDNINLALTSSVYDGNLSSYGKNNGLASGFISNTFESRNEKYILYPKTISLSKIISNKVTTFTNNIDPIQRSYNSSNILGLTFSITNVENKSIFFSLNPEINDIVGNPSFLIDDVEGYNELNLLYKIYRKYYTPIGIQNYINISYKNAKNYLNNIGQFLPASGNFVIGSIIEPNILERINVVLNKSVSIQNLVYSVKLPTMLPALTNKYLLYESNIDISEKPIETVYPNYTSTISEFAPALESMYLLHSSVIDNIAPQLESNSAFKGTSYIFGRDDRIFTQGIKKKNFITSFVTSSSGPNFYTIQFDSIYEPATSSFIEPISNFKPSMTYNTSSGNFYLKRNSAMEPLYDVNYNTYYATNHIRYYIYNSTGKKRSYFLGTQNSGPEHLNGATTIDGKKVIEITFYPVNKISVISRDEDKSRLRVDGVEINL